MTNGARTRESLAALGMIVALACGLAGRAAAQATIKPGMTEAEVRRAFGAPLTARKLGAMTYLYYRNDCFRRCGTYDVVFLEGGQVIDAVLRDSHRVYDGVSSSPKDRKPGPTTPRN